MRKSDFIFQYRVRNWPEYNRALVRRGSLILWIDEQMIETWLSRGCSGYRGGRPRVYADAAIECALVIKSVFQLSLRATQGFLQSVIELMNVDLSIPDYTTICRRQSGLQLKLTPMRGPNPLHLVIDSTGLKVFGAGEWQVRKHGMGGGRRRTWRKLHLGVDETSKEIVAADLTTSGVHDSQQLPALLEKTPGYVVQVSGNKAYDSRACYEAILRRAARVTIPPRRRARLSGDRDPPLAKLARDLTPDNVETGAKRNGGSVMH